MGARADDTAEAGFALLTLLVNGREYEVIYVDFTSHLLTTDAFLLEATKVIECAPLHLHTCYTVCTTTRTRHSIVIYLLPSIFSILPILSIPPIPHLIQYHESACYPWLTIGAQVRKLWASSDEGGYTWTRGK